MHRKYVFWVVCRKCIFFYNSTDVIKFMVLFHLQRLDAEIKVFCFSNFWKIKCRKRFLKNSNSLFSYNCLLFCIIISGNRLKIFVWKTLLYRLLNSLQTDVRFNYLGQKLWEKIHFLQPKGNFSGEGKNTSKHNTNINYV